MAIFSNFLDIYVATRNFSSGRGENEPKCQIFNQFFSFKFKLKKL